MMTRREGTLEGNSNGGYLLYGRPLQDGDPLDVLVGSTWIAGYLHYEASNENWYCDAGIMSIPLYVGREARFRLELVGKEQEEENVSQDWGVVDERDARRGVGSERLKEDQDYSS